MKRWVKHKKFKKLLNRNHTTGSLLVLIKGRSERTGSWPRSLGTPAVATYCCPRTILASLFDCNKGLKVKPELIIDSLLLKC